MFLKLLLLLDRDGVQYNLREVNYDYDNEFSFKMAAKILSKKSQRMRKNEKFLKLSKAIQMANNNRGSARRSVRTNRRNGREKGAN